MIVFNSLLVSCLVFYVQCYGILQQENKGRKSVSFDRFDKTCGARTMPVILDLTGLRFEDNIVYINATVTVNEDITDDPRVVISIERCKTREDLNTCEDFHTIKSSSYCNTLKVPGFYTTFISTFQPLYTCPLKKGVYKTDHGSADVRGFILFPTSGWYWKLKQEVFETKTNRKLMCFKTEARFY